MSEQGPRRIAAPLRMQVVDDLRAVILRGDYAPGERLVEGPLCERFDVSRTVIREALRQLESENLVTIVPYKGPTVTTLTTETARALFEVRGALEGLAGELFAQRASATQRKRLIKAYQGLKIALANDDLQRRLAAKDRYYDALIDGAHNDIIGTTLRGIHARVQMLRGLSLSAPGRAVDTLAELDLITTAAAIDRDPERARLACIDHVIHSQNVALTALEHTAVSAKDG